MRHSTRATPAGAIWTRSSYSSAQGNACVEVATLPDGAHAVRDSKRLDSTVLVLESRQFRALLARTQAGQARTGRL